MTFKPYLADAWGDLTRLAAPHLRKWSTQIAGVEYLTVATVLLPFIDYFGPKTIIYIFLGFSLLKQVASMVPQKRVKMYDPTKFELIPIRKRSAGDE